jgi:hypothetical protein
MPCCFWIMWISLLDFDWKIFNVFLLIICFIYNIYFDVQTSWTGGGKISLSFSVYFLICVPLSVYTYKLCLCLGSFFFFWRRCVWDLDLPLFVLSVFVPKSQAHEIWKRNAGKDCKVWFSLFLSPNTHTHTLIDHIHRNLRVNFVRTFSD